MEQQFHNVFQTHIGIADAIFIFAFELVCLVYHGPDPEKHYSPSSARYVRVKAFPKPVESWESK